jgi:RES domain-containing protein
MRAWRLVATRHAPAAFDGVGAARYGGRWNQPGLPMVYLADSLALATLELSVHLTGGRVTYTAIEVELPDELVDDLDPADLRRAWRTDVNVTRRVAEAWVRSERSLALRVPSALIDARSGERNVLLAPRHPAMAALRELQRFSVTLDERL